MEEKKEKNETQRKNYWLWLITILSGTGCVILWRKNTKLKGMCEEQKRILGEQQNALNKSYYYLGRDMAARRK